MSLYEYNSIKDTLHLTSTNGNHKRLEKEIENMNAQAYQKTFIEE